MGVRTLDQAFETYLTRLVPSKTHRQTGVSHRASVKAALEARLAIYRSFETGSYKNGTGVRGHSDIDLLISLKGDRPTSDTALRWVREALQARFPTTSVSVRRPGVVVGFGSGYETWEVIPGFLYSSAGDHHIYSIPGITSGWIYSSPESHIGYVNRCNANPKGKAKALARLLKAWKYSCNVPISSFYLEMRAAQHVNSVDTYIHIWDFCLVLEKLDQHGLSAMNDPTGSTGRIYACGTDAQGRDALSKVSTAATRARKALTAYRNDDFITAFNYLDLLFNGNFPARYY